MKIMALLEVEIDEQELAKLNRKAQAHGRPARTAWDVVENAVTDALRHQWATPRVRLLRGVESSPVSNQRPAAQEQMFMDYKER